MKIAAHINILRNKKLNDVMADVATKPTNASEVAALVGISRTSAQDSMNYLKHKGRIRLVHHWEVVERPDH